MILISMGLPGGSLRSLIFSLLLTMLALFLTWVVRLTLFILIFRRLLILSLITFLLLSFSPLGLIPFLLDGLLIIFLVVPSPSLLMGVACLVLAGLEGVFRRVLFWGHCYLIFLFLRSLPVLGTLRCSFMLMILKCLDRFLFWRMPSFFRLTLSLLLTGSILTLCPLVLIKR